MKYRAARKVGWIWTRAGWKRVPLRCRRVKKVPMPSKHRTRKLFMVKPAEPKGKKIKPVEAPQMAAGQGSADSAPTLALKAENLAMRQIRRAWSGKYAALNPPEAIRAGGAR
jgi:hypothetical protein